MKRLSSLTIFFPAYNDAATITGLVKTAEKTARSLTSDFEILVINDGSTDSTADVIQELKKSHPSLRLITHKNNKGYGGALISGFRNASKDWVFYTDGDGQYDPSELSLLVRAATESIDVINGYKIKRHDPMYRIIIGAAYNHCIHFLFHPPVKDIDCDFRLIRRSLLNTFRLTSQSGAICLELIMKLARNNARFISIPVHHYPRHHGHSRFFAFSSLYKTARDVRHLYRTFMSSKNT